MRWLKFGLQDLAPKMAKRLMLINFRKELNGLQKHQS